ncbi:hypothetical protein HII13_001846 [Brettanomyces bruxellensis]|nr:hypothetical protein HII13_001846 [Brettanomyces bruxellensis]
MSNNGNQSQPQIGQMQSAQRKYPPLKFDEVPILPLEQVRPRLNQLVHSLRKMEDLLRARQPLPNWIRLQNQFNVILSQLNSFSRALDANKMALSSSDSFPNYEFDTTQHEGLLTTLLRKKHLPEVDEWISSVDSVSADAVSKDEDMAKECTRIAEELLQKYVFGGYITKEEGEHGLTMKDVFGYEAEPSINDSIGQSDKLTQQTEDDIYRFIYQGLDSKVSF